MFTISSTFKWQLLNFVIQHSQKECSYQVNPGPTANTASGQSGQILEDP